MYNTHIYIYKIVIIISLFTIKTKKRKAYKKDSSFDAVNNIFLLVLVCLNQIWQCQGARLAIDARRIYLIFRSMFIIR